MPEPRKSKYPGVYVSGQSSWQYKIRLPPDPVTGKRPTETRGGYATDYAAHLARSARLVELGLGVNTAPSELTVTQAVQEYIAGKPTLKPNSRYNYGKLVDRYITPHIGSVRVRDLTPARVRQWQATLVTTGRLRGTGGLAPSTVNLTRGLLASTIKQLHQDGALARNVVAQVDGIPEDEYVPDTWDDAEIARFLSVADQDEYAALWRLCLFSLLRPGEAIGLRWDDVDLPRRAVKVANTLSRDGNGRSSEGSPKTPSSAAEVGITRETAAQLQRLQDTQRFAAKIRPEAWRHDLVFPNRNGRMIQQHQQLNDRLSRLCRKAGVPVLTGHELRHTGASSMMRNGVDPSTLSRTLRHRSPAFSLRLYSHQRLADTVTAVDRLEDALGKQDEDEKRKEG